MPPRIGYYISTTISPFMLPVLRELPRDLVEVLVPQEEAQSPLAGALREMGFATRALDVPSLPAYDLMVLDQLHLLYSDVFSAYPHAATRFLCLQHSTDNYGLSVPRAQYSIRAHKMLAQCACEKDQAVYRDENPDLCDQLCTLPPHAKEEFAYSGPYHLDEWAEKRHLPKVQLRQELEQALGMTLPKDKPVVAFFLDEASHEGQLVEGLRALAPHATIIYKSYERDDPREKLLQGAVIPWPSVAYAPNILRFGADYLLTGYNSGTFVTGVMLGLRVLPFYTRLIYNEGRSVKRLSSYKTRIPAAYSDCINCNCLLGLDMVYDIQATQTLVQAMHDPAVWKKYEERLPETQRRAFGDYCIEGAPQKTALLILKALHRGTFGKDATTIRLRHV